MTTHTYVTKGTCAKVIIADIDDETKVVNSLSFTGGCPGNLSALSTLLAGKKIGEIIAMFKGNTCGNKSTSCMDQLATMLEEISAK